MIRQGHGNGKGRPHIELPRIPQLTEGVPGSFADEKPAERDAKGRFVPGAKTSASKGGTLKAGTTRLAGRMGFADELASEEFKPYLKAAADYRRVLCTQLAETVGGGFCGPGPSSFVASAAWQLAASRYFFDLGARTGDPKCFAEGSRFANESRQNVLAAHELCAREAQNRPKPTDAFWANAGQGGESE